MQIGIRNIFHCGKNHLATRFIWDFGHIEFANFYNDGSPYSDEILATTPLMDLIAIYINPQHRGKGKAAIMLKAVSRYARKNGFKGIFTCACPLFYDGMQLTRLVTLFERHGFKKQYENISPPYTGMLKVLN